MNAFFQSISFFFSLLSSSEKNAVVGFIVVVVVCNFMTITYWFLVTFSFSPLQSNFCSICILELIALLLFLILRCLKKCFMVFWDLSFFIYLLYFFCECYHSCCSYCDLIYVRKYAFILCGGVSCCNSDHICSTKIPII